MANNWIYKVRSNTLQKRLFCDLEKGIFTDIIFRVGPDGNRRTFQAHRLVLASENAEFEKLLHGSYENKKIKIPDVHPKAFENLIRYCYGKSIRFKDLASIRYTCLAAEKFKAPNLLFAAENELIDLLKSESLIEIMKVCIELNLPRAKDRCLEVISSRPEKVWTTKEFISAPLEIKEQILSLCPDNGSDVCSDVITRFISMMECDDIRLNPMNFFVKRKSGQLPVPQLDAKNCLASKKVSLAENVFTEIASAVGNDSLNFLDDVTKFKVEQETLLKEGEVVADEVKVFGLKEKDIIVEQETSEPKDESKADYNSNEDGSVIEDVVVNELIKEGSKLIKGAIEDSSEDTVIGMIKTLDDVTKHAAVTMQNAVNAMAHALYFATRSSNASEKPETKST